MSKFKLIILILSISLLLLVGCALSESNNVDKSIDYYFTNLIEGKYKEAFTVVNYYTDEPNVLLAEEALEDWLNRVEEAWESKTYISGYSVETIEVIEDGQFANSKVILELVEEGQKSTRTIYLHLEKIDEVWKIEGIWNESQEEPDVLNSIYGGFIP